MSKPRIKIIAEVDTLAHAQTIATAIANRVSTTDIFENHGIKAYFDDENQKNMVVAELRFNVRLDRDNVTDWIKDQVKNHPQVKNWVTAVRVESHLCSHDDATVLNCRTTEFVEWNRG